MVKIAVLISGGGTNLQAIIDEIHTKDIAAEIVAVISNKREAYGLTRASQYNIPKYYIGKKNVATTEAINKKIKKLLEDQSVDLVILAGYLGILSKDIIATYPKRIINIHPSLIPSFCGKGYYGKKVHEAVIDTGVKYTGATVHFVDEGIDTGEIIDQVVVEVLPEDTVESVAKKVLAKEHELLVKCTKELVNTINSLGDLK